MKQPVQRNSEREQKSAAAASARHSHADQQNVGADYNSTAMQRKLAQTMQAGPQSVAQRALSDRLNESPRMTAQRKQMDALAGAPAQKMDAEEDALQGKFNNAPLQAVEEEEPLQGKFNNAPLQAVEEEEPLQGKFGSAPLQAVEEEEPLQGKFGSAPLQAVEEEEPLQGKFGGAPLQAVEEEEPLQGKFSNAPLQAVEEEEPLQGKSASSTSPLQAKEEPGAKANNTGLPDNLKAGVESLSGMAMDDVKVHYNSPQPAQMQAHAYAQGTEIHVGPGQEQHLPHEAWHVAQQKQGRVQPTVQAKGVPVNDDKSLEAEADAMGARALQAKPIKQDGTDTGGGRAGLKWVTKY